MRIGDAQHTLRQRQIVDNRIITAAHLYNLRQMVGHCLKSVKNILLIAVLQNFRVSRCTYRTNIERLSFKQRGIGPCCAFGFAEQLAGVSVRAIDLLFASRVDLGLIGCNFSLNGRQLLTQAGQFTIEIALVLFFAQSQLVFVGVRLFRNPDHLRLGEIDPVFLACG